jgi:hypothetical protein
MAKFWRVRGSKAQVRQAAIADLVTTVGTADGTIADVGGSFNQTTLNNNFKDIATQVNSILAALRGSNIIVP